MRSELRVSPVSSRLVRLNVGFVSVLVIAGALSFGTLSRLKVNGPVYQKIETQKDLLADILPPPMYVIESYMTALQMLGEKDPAAQQANLERLKSLQRDYNERTDFWTKQLADSPTRNALLEDSRKSAVEFYAVLNGEFIPAIQKQDTVAANAIAYQKLKAAYAEHRRNIDRTVTLATQESDALQLQAEREVRYRTWLMEAVLVGGLLIIGLYSLSASRSLVGTIRSTADRLAEGSFQVSSAAEQVSSSSQTLAEGATEQAASLEEISSALEEVACMARRNTVNAQTANEAAKQARSAADKGMADMKTMMDAMTAIRASSGDVANIIKTIDEIAFQTNILSLNAAVEAARAGEAGMGFAVVADEVRNLSKRSAEAAKETAERITTAIDKTAQGVDISAKVAKGLDEIVAKVRQVDELAAEVANASREQTQGLTQINSAVAEMDKVTQGNASGAEESAAASETLSGQANAMKESVVQLLMLAGSAQEPEKLL